MLRRKILHINKFTAYSCIYIIFSVKETNLLYIWSFIGYSVNIYYILDGYNNLSVVEIQQNRALYKGDMIITFTDITTPWIAMKKWCLGKRRLSVFICVILKCPSYTQQTHLRNKIYFSRSSRSLQIPRDPWDPPACLLTSSLLPRNPTFSAVPADGKGGWSTQEIPFHLRLSVYTSILEAEMIPLTLAEHTKK